MLCIENLCKQTNKPATTKAYLALNFTRDEIQNPYAMFWERPSGWLVFMTMA